jgi:Glycosyl hydrolases family 2, TIM barrel domain/Glycosyl hydrolases family 2, sugar binding domain/Glycosyl hydrolases family 2/Beta galactosidase small chain
VIDRRLFLSSLAASSLIGARSVARILNDGAGDAPTVESPHRLPGPRPLPDAVQGVHRCVIDLNGPWQFSATVPSGFQNSDLEKLSWTQVQMPNELEMAGLSVKSDTEYVLRRRFEIPRDFAGKAIVVRFDGVYSYARVWINGHYVRDHQGGFTSWDCEIAQHVTPGESADLIVVLVDRSDDSSGQSAYAKHSIAGILRDVCLVALPRVHIEQLHLSSSLDEHYLSGLLDLQAYLGENAAAAATSLSISLRDPQGTDVPIQVGAPVRSGGTLKFGPIRVPNVVRWDSEHPHLYELVVELHWAGDIETLRRAVGFRRIERIGNQLLVNGERVILRGVCRHDIHPTRGRSPSRQNDEGDPALLRRAHINFVRTSHYPPTEAFLAACDRAGIYVEEETAVCFWKGGSDPALEERFLSQFGEMLSRDHGHPSVILWSLGNESTWGPPFSEELKRVRETDPGRPVIFSWSDTTGADQRLLDIYSSHYPLWDSDLGSSEFPVLHDEFAHVACYNSDDLRRDPGVRNFWGRSIAIFGEKFLETPGCLGGAIWAGIDEVFLLPDRIVGVGPWGILDGWRREKPEFWLTRKAFSPIRLKDGILPLPQRGDEPAITLGNAYDHTNLKELKIEWSVGSEHGVLQGPDVSPHKTIQFRVPVTRLRNGQILELCFRSSDGSEIDRFMLPVGERLLPVFASPGGALNLRSAGEAITISAPRFSLTIDRTTGLIRSAESNGRPVIEGGPFLNLGQGRPKTWSLTTLDVRELAHSIVVAVGGASEHSDKMIPLQFELEVFADGRMELRYRLAIKPEGKLDQLGMSFVLPAAVDRLKWLGQSLWSVYPDDHIGRPSGTAHRRSSRSARRSRTPPDWPWAEDMQEPFLDGYQLPAGAATNDFRSLREDVFWAGGFQGEALEHLRVESQG